MASPGAATQRAELLRRTQFAATNRRDADSVPDLMTRIKEAEVRARIQQAREEFGLNQDQFAELLDVGKRSIQNYESREGQNATVPYDKLGEIAAITGKSLKWLLHGDDDEVTQLLTRLDRFEEQQAEINRTLNRLFPDGPGGPITMEAAVAMFKKFDQQLEEWSERMARDQIGKRELDRRTRRDARAKDHQEPPGEAVA